MNRSRTAAAHPSRRVTAVRVAPGVRSSATATAPISPARDLQEGSRPAANPLDDAIAQAVTLGFAELKAERIDNAAALCEEALRLQPGNQRGLFLAALVSLAIGQRRAAIADFDRAIQVAPRALPDIWLDLVLTLLDLGEVAEAERRARAAVEIWPADPTIVALLGRCLSAAGRHDESVAVLSAAATLPDAGPAVHGELGTALMTLGRREEALQEWRIAVDRSGCSGDEAVRAVDVATVADWCATAAAPYRVVTPAGEGSCFRPWYGDDPGACEPVPVSRPETYVAEIPDALVGGDPAVVVAGDRTLLLDMCFRPDADRLDLGSATVRYLSREGALLDMPRRTERIPEGILLAGFAAANYYHWLVEFLPRLLVVERALVAPECPLLVDRRVLAVGQLAAALAAANVQGRPIVALDPQTSYRVDRLVLASPLAWLAPNLRNNVPLVLGDNQLAREAVGFLRDRLAPGVDDRTGCRRLFVARRPMTTFRRLLNAPDVQAVFESFGFETVTPEVLSFDEQRALFADAAVVAGESGAGLTNILFAPRSAILMCLQAEMWPMQVYADLAGWIGQRTTFVVGEPVGEHPLKPYQVPFGIDLDLLSARVARVVEAVESTSTRRGNR